MAKKKKGTKKTGQPKTADKLLPVEPVDKSIPTLITIPAKICRLCESKEGPFLNIFDADKVASKKIEDVLPFVIAENDDLPHKICFRCSAKVEELHEFIQKCIKTQENLCTSLGKKTTSIVTKPKTHRLLWEEKLNKSNVTNDDICDAVVKKAMEGMKDLSFKPLVGKTTIEKLEKVNKKTEAENKEHSKITDIDTNKSDTETIVSKIEKENESEITPKRASRSSINKPLFGGLEELGKKKKINKSKDTIKAIDAPPEASKSIGEAKTKSEAQRENVQTNNKSVENGTGEKNESKVEKPFSIMEHVNMIKVTGVGLLFQCKLCNRNFLKKEVVLSHWCAKNGAAKDDFTRKTAIAPVSNNPPKVATVKYINTSVNENTKKQVVPDSGNRSQKMYETKVIDMTQHGVTKQKPRIGPASKVKRINNDSAAEPNNEANKNPESLVQMPSVPNMNSHYKLVQGPMNTLMLVEAASSQKSYQEIDLTRTIKEEKRPQKKEAQPQPYPVGLIQTMPRRADQPEFPQMPASFQKTHEKKTPYQVIAPFQISEEKKQSYQVIQTSNPNKLLISAKVKPQEAEPLPKKQKKTQEVVPQQPYSVTLEDASRPKDTSFFTFVNVDPLLQPSYVLPTNSNVETRPTMTAVTTNLLKHANNLYTCNICDQQFSREQKLLAHIHSHYSKIEDDEQSTSNKSARKRARKN